MLSEIEFHYLDQGIILLSTILKLHRNNLLVVLLIILVMVKFKLFLSKMLF